MTAWEALISRTIRLDLERALIRLCRGDAALLAAALDGGPVLVPTVHLRVDDGARCGALNPGYHRLHDDPLAVTCVACKGTP